jgi:4-coumarate--CoA ligase
MSLTQVSFWVQGAVTAMPCGSSDVSGSISPVLPNMEMRIVDGEFRNVG